MTIRKNTVVTIQYRVTDSEGEVVDGGDEPLVYLHGGFGGIFPAIEAALEGKNVGDAVSVELEPDDAFGEYESELVLEEPRASFPAELEVGMQVEGSSPDEDDDEPMIYRVTEIEDGVVTLDGNHPLAGISLVFAATVTEVRPANANEIAHGHVHGHGDHHH